MWNKEIDWSSYSRDEEAGRKAYVDAEHLLRDNKYSKAISKYEIAESRYQACANFLKSFNLEASPDIERKIKRCQERIEQCNSLKSQQVRTM